MGKIWLEIQKWQQTIVISWSKILAYKLNFFLQIIGPVLVFYLIKYNLWRSIYDLTSLQVIQGFSLEKMLEYHAMVMIVTLLGQGFNSMNLSEDIRMGRISSYLIYPFTFWQYHFAYFIGFQIIQLVLALFTLWALPSLGLIHHLSWEGLLIGTSYTILVSVFWFAISFLIGIFSFWLEETWVLRVVFGMVSVFLSGAVIPVDLFPQTFQTILKFTPFPYLTYIPVKLLMGESVPNVIYDAGLLALWILIIVYISKVTWQRGIKLYTAAGM